MTLKITAIPGEAAKAYLALNFTVARTMNKPGLIEGVAWPSDSSEIQNAALSKKI